MAIATDGTHTITILWNDGNGDFSERSHVWVSVTNQEELIGMNLPMFKKLRLESLQVTVHLTS